MQCRGHGNIVALSDIGLTLSFAKILLTNIQLCVVPHSSSNIQLISISSIQLLISLFLSHLFNLYQVHFNIHCLTNPHNAETTFVLSTRTQRYLKTILTLSCWYSHLAIVNKHM